MAEEVADPRETSGTGPLAPGLYLVATPIGHARDITLRALDVLGSADVLAAEDTRNTGRLLMIHGIKRPAEGRMVPYHDHNGAAMRPRLLGALAEGRSVALVSDAGTPLVADPGYRLVTEAIAAGHRVTAVPGASATLAALSIAGLPSDRFLFAGFLPPRSGGRRRSLGELAAVPATLVFYESPHRLAESLGDMAAVLGAERAGAVCREITKRFEEVERGTLDELATFYAAAPEPRGEIVVVIGPPLARALSPETLDAALAEAMRGSSLRDAVSDVAEALGMPRREVYARALEVGRAADEEE